MCGIAGTYGVLNSEKTLSSLMYALQHRGLDEEGILINGSKSLGMCQLKLIQFQKNSLPIHMKKENVYISYNGEIYNWRQDSSTIWHGPKCIEDEVSALFNSQGNPGIELDGMYAAALYFVEEDKITLTRDPFGIKPMYWAFQNPGYAFSSEINALKSLLPSHTEIDFDSLYDILFFGRVLDSEKTVYKNIFQVSKGSSVSFRNEMLTKKKNIHKKKPGEISAHKSLDELLKESVARCLKSERKIGLAISGGVDSSLLAHYINELGYKDLTTISIKIEGSNDYLENLDELGMETGGAWGSWEHLVIEFNKEDYLQLLEESVKTMGEPFSMSSVPLYLKIAQSAQEKGIKILLSGEGSDELFMGYDSYKSLLNAECASLDEKLFEFYCSKEKSDLLTKLFGKEVSDMKRSKFLSIYTADKRESLLDQIRDIEKDMSLEPLLQRIDRCLMKYNIEGRTPFLHGGIPEYALGLCPGSLINKSESKKVLYDLYLSKFSNRKKISNKTAFRIPTEVWFEENLIDKIHSEQYITLFKKLFGKQEWDYFFTLLKDKNNRTAYSVFHTLYTILVLEKQLIVI